MPVPADDVPVRISWLERHWPVLLLVVIGGMASFCALGSLAALVVTGLIEVSWTVPAGVGFFH